METSMTAKRKRGRPKKATRKPEWWITCRASKTLYDATKRAAAKRGMTWSEWIREAVRDTANLDARVGW